MLEGDDLGSRLLREKIDRRRFWLVQCETTYVGATCLPFRASILRAMEPAQRCEPQECAIDFNTIALKRLQA